MDRRIDATAVASCPQTTCRPLPKLGSQLKSGGWRPQKVGRSEASEKYIPDRNLGGPYCLSPLQVPEDGAIRRRYFRLLRKSGYHKVRLGRGNRFCGLSDRAIIHIEETSALANKQLVCASCRKFMPSYALFSTLVVFSLRRVHPLLFDVQLLFCKSMLTGRFRGNTVFRNNRFAALRNIFSGYIRYVRYSHGHCCLSWVTSTSILGQPESALGRTCPPWHRP